MRRGGRGRVGVVVRGVSSGSCDTSFEWVADVVVLVAV